MTFGVVAALSAGVAWYFSLKVAEVKGEELSRFQQESKAAIAVADARAVEAVEGTAKALAEAASVNERSEKLELEVSQQRERAAKAEKDLIELQQRVKRRALTSNQRAQLIESLQQSPIKGEVVVVCVLGDDDGVAFAGQIHSVLQAAGWPSKGPRQLGGFSGGGNPIGLSILVHNAKDAPEHASVLRKAFDAVGIQLVGFEKPSEVDPGVVHIQVGNKP